MTSHHPTDDEAEHSTVEDPPSPGAAADGGESPTAVEPDDDHSGERTADDTAGVESTADDQSPADPPADGDDPSDPQANNRSGDEPLHDQDLGVHRPEPAVDHTTWTTGEQYGFGTACDHDAPDPSRVWFALSEGALTEPRFPRVDVPQFRLVDFLVADPDGDYVARTHDHSSRGEDTIERATVPAERDAPTYRQTIEEHSGGRSWTLVVEYVTDPDAETVLIDVAFDAEREYDLFVVAEPTIGGFVDGTVGDVLDLDEQRCLVARNESDRSPELRQDADPVAAAIAADDGFEHAVTATYGDAESTREAPSGSLPGPLSPVHDGRILVGQVATGTSAAEATIAVGFSEGTDPTAAVLEAEESLDRGFDAAQNTYVRGWQAYLAERSVPDSVEETSDLEAQYFAAIQCLRAVEDKTFEGASVASPSIPWGNNVDATEPRDYGYNFVWSRDQYQVFTALLAAGDVEGARAALEYLYEHQQRDDGFLPQNTYLDGRTRWSGEQLDNVSYPAVMAYQLDREGGVDVDDASYEYDDIRRSIEYVLRSGPRSEQERWEEEGGYSPSTIAAAAAGLGCAAALAEDHGTRGEALAYLAHADWWRTAVDDWCATTTGTDDHDRTPYYVRVTRDGNPDAGHERTLANNGPTLDERAIIDAGFLELVRLGLRDPDDPLVERSLTVVDDVIRVDTPNGPGWYRYNGDGYGELGASEPDEGAPWSMDRQGSGRLWPIFTGERAEYELLAGTEDGPLAPERLLETMADFGNDGRMLPEQVWDRPDPTAYDWTFGEGTGAATPLAWSMAQYVRLAHAIDAGEPVETPGILARRYRDGAPDGPSLTVESIDRSDGRTVLEGTTDGDELVVWTEEGVTRSQHSGEGFELRLDGTPDSIAVIAATDRADLAAVGTAIERIDSE